MRNKSPLSPPAVGVPNAVHCVAVMLSRHDGNVVTQTMTQSWSAGSREAAIVHALDYAKEQRPGFGIDQWLVADIPLPLIPMDDGVRTAPRVAADIVRQFDAGRSGLIFNLERLADHLDACHASAIEAAAAGETPKSGSTEGERAGAKPDAQGPSQ